MSDDDAALFGASGVRSTTSRRKVSSSHSASRREDNGESSNDESESNRTTSVDEARRGERKRLDANGATAVSGTGNGDGVTVNTNSIVKSSSLLDDIDDDAGDLFGLGSSSKSSKAIGRRRKEELAAQKKVEAEDEKRRKQEEKEAERIRKQKEKDEKERKRLADKAERERLIEEKRERVRLEKAQKAAERERIKQERERAKEAKQRAKDEKKKKKKKQPAQTVSRSKRTRNHRRGSEREEDENSDDSASDSQHGADSTGDDKKPGHHDPDDVSIDNISVKSTDSAATAEGSAPGTATTPTGGSPTLVVGKSKKRKATTSRHHALQDHEAEDMEHVHKDDDRDDIRGKQQVRKRRKHMNSRNEKEHDDNHGPRSSPGQEMLWIHRSFLSAPWTRHQTAAASPRAASQSSATNTLVSKIAGAQCVQFLVKCLLPEFPQFAQCRHNHEIHPDVMRDAIRSSIHMAATSSSERASSAAPATLSMGDAMKLEGELAKLFHSHRSHDVVRHVQEKWSVPVIPGIGVGSAATTSSLLRRSEKPLLQLTETLQFTTLNHAMCWAKLVLLSEHALAERVLQSQTMEEANYLASDIYILETRKNAMSKPPPPQSVPASSQTPTRIRIRRTALHASSVHEDSKADTTATDTEIAVHRSVAWSSWTLTAYEELLHVLTSSSVSDILNDTTDSHVSETDSKSAIVADRSAQKQDAGVTVTSAEASSSSDIQIQEAGASAGATRSNSANSGGKSANVSLSNQKEYTDFFVRGFSEWWSPRIVESKRLAEERCTQATKYAMCTTSAAAGGTGGRVTTAAAVPPTRHLEDEIPRLIVELDLMKRHLWEPYCRAILANFCLVKFLQNSELAALLLLPPLHRYRFTYGLPSSLLSRESTSIRKPSALSSSLSSLSPSPLTDARIVGHDETSERYQLQVSRSTDQDELFVSLGEALERTRQHLLIVNTLPAK